MPDSPESLDRIESERLFDLLWAEHRRPVHAFLTGRIGDAEAALDLTQETFSRVWRHARELRAMSPDSRRYWIFGVARNLATDEYRRRARRSDADEEILRNPDRFSPPSENPADQAERSEELDALDRAIRRLPDEMRIPLMMQILSEMTSAQIAEALAIPAGTVRYRIHQARKRLAADRSLSECEPTQERAKNER